MWITAPIPRKNKTIKKTQEKKKKKNWDNIVLACRIVCFYLKSNTLNFLCSNLFWALKKFIICIHQTFTQLKIFMCNLGLE